MTENQRYPNILQAIWILILLHILSTVLLILWYSFARVTGFPLLAHPAVISLIYVVVFGLILMRGLKRANTSFREICPLAPVRLSLLFPMALTIIGVFSLQLQIESWETFFPSPAEWYPEWYTDFIYNLVVATNDLVVYPMWVMGVDFVIVGPLTEELLVRGLILRGFLSRYSARKAVLASALLSGLMHLNSWNFVGIILGILLAWWFIQTRSMLPCFLGHTFYGALFFALSPLEIRFHPLLEIWYPLWRNLVGVILTSLGIWLLIRQFRKSSDTVPEDGAGDKPDQL